MFVASLRQASPDFAGRIFVAEPQPGALWRDDPRIADQGIRDRLQELGAELLPFASRHFGASYPIGNKIELLRELPRDTPFVFFDSDTLITGEITSVPFDFDRPAASLACEGTWPQPPLYGPGYAGIWKSLYDRFRLDFESSLDTSHPSDYWRRYLYFNAGWFSYRCPHRFGELFERFALDIRDTPPTELSAQKLTPWLDQIALPLVVHALGGGRDGLAPGYLDGETSCHYRHFPLLYAQASDAVVKHLETVAAPNRLKKVLKGHEPIKRMVYQGRGAKVRALFDRDRLPRREAIIRNRIRKAGFWMR